jgi:hypothetical protein
MSPPSLLQEEGLQMIRKRVFMGAAGITTALALAVAAPATAHECYNASRSSQGNTSGANGQGLASLTEILTTDVFGLNLCPAGAQHVLTGLADAGFRTDILINTKTLMAGGLDGTHPELLNNGSGIDHLSQAFFDTVDPLIGEGFGICA